MQRVPQESINKKESEIEVARLLVRKIIENRNFNAFSELTEDENMELLQFAEFDL